MKKTTYLNSTGLVIFLSILFSLNSCDNSSTGPNEPKANMVTFQGQAFLAGQPPPVNQWHLPLNYDIEIISFLQGDSTSFDTTYTDSSGGYISTRQRKDGLYTLVSRYPYYSNDTVHVEIMNGQVIGEIPRLFSQRLMRIQIFPDSTVYHSLRSIMLLSEYITNFSSNDTLPAPIDLNQLLIMKKEPSTILSASNPNDTYAIELFPLQTQVRHHARLVANFADHTGTKTVESGESFLYATGHTWALAIAPSYPHYSNSFHWHFKIIEATTINIKLD